MNKPYDRKEVEQKQDYEAQKRAMKESGKPGQQSPGDASPGEESKPVEE